MSKETSKAPKVYKIPPSLIVSEDDLPEIRNWRVGSIYNVRVKMKQVSSSLDAEDSNSKKITARFHILEIISDNPNKKPKESKESIDKGIERLKEKYNKT